MKLTRREKNILIGTVGAIVDKYLIDQEVLNGKQRENIFKDIDEAIKVTFYEYRHDAVEDVKEKYIPGYKPKYISIARKFQEDE